MKNRIITIRRFCNYVRYFGLRMAWFYIVYPYFGGKKAILRRQKEIKRYLKKEFTDILSKYKAINYEPEVNKNSRPIWVCWLQGEDKMPEIVRSCYHSICSHSAGRKVILITEDNLKKYIEVPEFITEKVRKGEILRTHYADYIRILLLKTHGGFWIDATILVTDDITLDCGLSFFSQKQKPDSIYYVSQYRWHVGLLSCSPACGQYMFGCLEELFRTYLCKRSFFIDFFLFDYFLAVMYEELLTVKQMIDECPYNNTLFYQLADMLDEAYNDDKMREIKKNGIFNKLTWKRQFNKSTKDNRETFYGVILKKWS